MARPDGTPAPGPYVPPAVYGPADGREPPRRPLLPWLLVGGALLVGSVAVLLVVLLGARDDGTATAADPTASGASPSPGPRTPDGGRYEDSERVARAWVEAMRTGDHRTAFDLSCPNLQAAAAAGALGGDAAEELGAYFVDRVLDGRGFTAATVEQVDHDEVSDTDVVSFSLIADDGTTVLLDLFVLPAGTVCDFL